MFGHLQSLCMRFEITFVCIVFVCFFTCIISGKDLHDKTGKFRNSRGSSAGRIPRMPMYRKHMIIFRKHLFFFTDCIICIFLSTEHTCCCPTCGQCVFTENICLFTEHTCICTETACFFTDHMICSFFRTCIQYVFCDNTCLITEDTCFYRLQNTSGNPIPPAHLRGTN